jgi:hypothetical protein
VLHDPAVAPGLLSGHSDWQDGDLFCHPDAPDNNVLKSILYESFNK